MVNPAGPLNSSAPTTSTVVGGVYNPTPPAPLPAQVSALQVDAQGNLRVNVVVGGSGGGSVNLTGINGVPPALTNPLAVELSDGTQALGTASNPIRVNPTGTTIQPVSGTVAVSNPFNGVVTQPTGTNLHVVVDSAPTTVVNQGTSPWVISGAVTVSGTSTAIGTLTNNNAVPAATNLGVLGFIAESAYANLTYTTGDQVLAVTDIHGAVNNDLQAVAGIQLGPTAVTAFGAAPAAVNVPAVNSSIFAGVTGITATGSSLNVNVTGTATTTIPTPTNWGTAPAISVAVPAVNAELFAGQTLLAAAPASTVATAVQPSLVVQVSPNQPSALFLGTVPATAPPDTVLVGEIFNSSPPVPTTGQTLPLQSDSRGSLYVIHTGRTPTYRAAAIAFLPVASATSPLWSIQGSATKIIRVRRIKVSWSSTTGNSGGNTLSMRRYSALTGGTTGSTPALSKDDTTDPAGTAVVLQYSAVPTVATAVGGFMSAESMFWESATPTASLPVPIEWTFGEEGGEAITLRGTADYLGINMSAIGAAGALAWIRVMWTEE